MAAIRAPSNWMTKPANSNPAPSTQPEGIGRGSPLEMSMAREIEP